MAVSPRSRVLIGLASRSDAGSHRVSRARYELVGSGAVVSLI